MTLTDAQKDMLYMLRQRPGFHMLGGRSRTILESLYEMKLIDYEVVKTNRNITHKARALPEGDKVEIAVKKLADISGARELHAHVRHMDDGSNVETSRNLMLEILDYCVQLEKK